MIGSLRNKRGATAIVIAVLMTTLLGFAALAIDLGMGPEPELVLMAAPFPVFAVVDGRWRQIGQFNFNGGFLKADEIGLGGLDLLRQRRGALGEVGGLDVLPDLRSGNLEGSTVGRSGQRDDVGAQVDVPGHDGYVAASHCGSSRDGYGAGGEDRNEGDTAGSHRKVSPDRFPDGHIWHVARTMLQARDGRCADLAAVSR